MLAVASDLTFIPQPIIKQPFRHFNFSKNKKTAIAAVLFFKW
jgi:hypothetical protein